MIYWFTGRSGAGKTTSALQLKDKLKSEGYNVLVLDGDDVREYFSNGFTDEDRFDHIMRIAKFAAIAEHQGIVTIIAMIAPKMEWRIHARKLFQESLLIYIKGGKLWTGTEYEEPTEIEEPLKVQERYQ